MTTSLDIADVGAGLIPKPLAFFSQEPKGNKAKSRVVQFMPGHHSNPTWASLCPHPKCVCLCVKGRACHEQEQAEEGSEAW